MTDSTDIVLSAAQAREIIQVAIDHKVHDGGIPAADKDALDLAGQIVWQAEAGERNGIEHEAIPEVMKIARDRSYFDPGEHGNPTAEEAAEAMSKRGKAKTNGAEPSPAAVAQEEDAEFDAQVDIVLAAMREGKTTVAAPAVFMAAAKLFTEEQTKPAVPEQPVEPSPPPAEPEEDTSHLPTQDEADAKTAENMARARGARQEAREAAQEADVVLSAYCRRGQHTRCGGSARVSGVTHSCACPCHAENAEQETAEPAEHVVPEALGGVKTAPIPAAVNAALDPVTTEPESVDLSSTSKAVDEVRRRNLPIPPEMDGEPPDLPRDISKLSAIELRSLHGQYHAALSSCIWLLALAEADQESVKSMVDEKISQAMLTLEAVDEKRSVTSIKAEAQDDPKVKKLRKTLLDVNAQVRLYKGLKEVYAETCARSSREMTFREMELQSAGSPSGNRR